MAQYVKVGKFGRIGSCRLFQISAKNYKYSNVVCLHQHGKKMNESISHHTNPVRDNNVKVAVKHIFGSILSFKGSCLYLLR